MAIYRPFGKDHAALLASILLHWRISHSLTLLDLAAWGRGYILGFVGRAKVANREFNVAKSSAADAFDRFSQGSFYVVGQHSYSSERLPNIFHLLWLDCLDGGSKRQ
jgi:hypothetical protein